VTTPDAGSNGTPLPRKLGIKHDSRVLLAAPPAGFDLDNTPAGAVIHRRAGASSYDVVVAFCPDQERLRSRIASCLPKLTTAGSLWLAWPKRAGGVASDLDETVVRDMGLAAGLVDVKVAAIDATWSALKFVRRLRDR
jgi:hypothetical protein